VPSLAALPHPRLEEAAQRARLLEAVREKSLELGIPSIDPSDGYVLYTAARIVAELHPEGLVAVDAGAGIGYSTLWIAMGLLDAGCRGCRLYAVEKEPALYGGLLETLRSAAWAGDVVEPVEGDALGELRRHGRLHLVFIDVEKHQYPETVGVVAERLAPGSAALWHNAFFPPPPARFYSLLDRSGLSWGVAPTPAGMVVAWRP